MRELTDILSEVNRKIEAAARRAHRSPEDVEIIAVTKTHGPDVVREAWEAGLTIMGENKVQEAAWKKESSLTGPSWHLIGHLQTNKVRAALSLFDFIHSVDSLKLVDRLETVAEELGVNTSTLLELNVSGEKSKTGMNPQELDETIRALLERCPRLTLEGFMTMAPFSENPEDARPYFRRLRELRDESEKRYGLSLPRLSMGMSGDYEVAIEEGATWVRLGTVLFGERPKLKAVRAASDDETVGACGLDSYSGAGPTVKVLD